MMHPTQNCSRYALLLTLALFAAACGPQSPEQPATQTPPVVTAQDRVDWYRDCWNDFNERQWDDFRKCYADNAQSQQLGYGKPEVSGSDAIVASSQDFTKSFPDGRGDGQLILVNDNKIAGLYVLKGTNSGPLIAPDGKEVPATNKKFGQLFGHYVELGPTTASESVQSAIQSLKVVKEFGVMDGGASAYQLGLSKGPARPVIDQSPTSPSIVIAKNDDVERKNVETDRAQIEAFNKHDAAAIDALVADDYVLHDQTSPKDMNKTENTQLNNALWKGFSDAKLNVSSIWGAGDYVVVIGALEGTNDGDFSLMNLRKTGKKVTVPFLSIDRIEADKLKETWLIFDTAMLAAQLGVQ
jgi:predicted ester cyclase